MKNMTPCEQFSQNWEANGRLGMFMASSQEGFNTVAKARRAQTEMQKFDVRVGQMSLFRDIAKIVETHLLNSPEMQSLREHHSYMELKEFDVNAIVSSMRHDPQFVTELLEGRKDEQSLQEMIALTRPIATTTLGIRDRLSAIDFASLSPQDASRLVLEAAIAAYVATQMWRTQRQNGAVLISEQANIPELSMISATVRSIAMNEETEVEVAHELIDAGMLPCNVDYYPAEKLRTYGFKSAQITHQKMFIQLANEHSRITAESLLQRVAIRQMSEMHDVPPVHHAADPREIPWNETYVQFRDGTKYGCNGQGGFEGFAPTPTAWRGTYICAKSGVEGVFPSEAFLAPISPEIDGAYLDIGAIAPITSRVRNLIAGGRTRLVRLWMDHPDMFRHSMRARHIVVETENALKVYDRRDIGDHAPQAAIPAGWTEITDPAEDADLLQGIWHPGKVCGMTKSVRHTNETPEPVAVPNDTPEVVSAEKEIRNIIHRRGCLTYPEFTHVLSSMGVNTSTQGKGSHESLHATEGQSTVSKKWRNETRAYTPTMVFSILSQLHIEPALFLMALKDYWHE